MERITERMLDLLVDRINKITGSPMTTYTKDDKGNYAANACNYHLDWAYGGVKLARICDDGHGVNDVSKQGFGTKRQLFDWMHAYIAGIDAGVEMTSNLTWKD
ncbi:MAG: hypothetical protein GY845_25690 [Planctomycetes bacterium]|nr:hypothetical protein [Planctomycetota bacterium]